MATYMLHSGIYSLSGDQVVAVEDDGKFYQTAPQCNTGGRGHGGSGIAKDQMPPTVGNKYAKIQDGLESSISIESRSRITEILTKTQQLSDVEKLLLYLKLPTGVPTDDSLRHTPPSCIHSSNRAEQAQAFTWIRSHLEVHGDVCMAKQEVYDDYKMFCDKHEIRALCNADFGKMMKQVFPDLKCRRLGQRGQSRYFYGGLHRKLEFDPPTLPEFELQTSNIEEAVREQTDEIFKASCQVVCEWAQKLLEVGFSGLRELAEHLVTNVYVNSKSFAACTVIASLQDSNSQNVKNSALFTNQPSSGGDKHKETTLQLQRKIHENKLMKEQRKKLQQMKEMEQSCASSSQERKTPVTPSRKSVTPSHPTTPARASCSRTPKLPSPAESPLALESPQKFGNSDTPRVSEHFHPMAVRKLENITITPTETGEKGQEFEKEAEEVTSKFSEGHTNVEDSVSKCSNMKIGAKSSTPRFVEVTFSSNNVAIGEEKGQKFAAEDGRYEEMDVDETLERNQISELTANAVIVTEVEREVISQQNKESGSESDSKSNDTDIEVISDEEVCDMKTDTEADNDQGHEIKSEVNKQTPIEETSLSKSTGYLSLKMLLGKDQCAESLNKSVGFLNSPKTHNLFANKAKIQTRSAFVPFTHVQSRKDMSSVCEVATTSSLENSKPSKAQNSSSSNSYTHGNIPQNSHVTMVALPQKFPANSEWSQGGSDMTRLPDNVITIIPATNISVTGTGNISMSTNIHASNSATSVGDVNVKSATSIVTTTKTHTAVSSNDAGITSLQSSPVTQKPIKTRFTPIRPKASPVKNPPAMYKDSKSDNPAYDKRPVSTILKEKRAREQVEAIAKFQASLKLQTVPNVQFAQNISFPNPGPVPSVPNVSRELFTLPVQNAQPGKDVVIIVNSKASGGPGNIQTILTSPSTNFIQNPFFGVKDSTNDPKVGDSIDISCIKVVSNDTLENENYENKSVVSSKATTENADTKTIETGKAHALDFMESETGTQEDDEISEQMDLVFSETPVKIAKLNVTSPFTYRSESVCSLGRETPIKVVKLSESSQNRPESACSYGRKTPTGARKRKSTELSQKQCFKRLNSTGEVEDMDDVSLDDNSLNSVGNLDDQQRLLHPRRTQSCTFELDKDSKSRHIYPKSQQILQPDSLQSPDISSLEREALIEAFPPSVGSIGPKFQTTQQSSVGVNVKALRNSQQKLIKEQQYLNQRCDKFLQKGVSGDSVVSDGVNGSNYSIMTENEQIMKSQVAVKAGSAVYDPGPGTKKLLSTGKGISKHDHCISELPSEVADFINESIEKSELNTEADAKEVIQNQKETAARASTDLPNLNIDLEHELISEKETTPNFGLTILQADTRAASKQDTELFTVPKVPPANVRVREGVQRIGLTDNQHGQTIQQRCSSLPSFTSPVRSMMSPVNRPGPYQRASSMSPRTAQNLEREISPISKIISPIQRVDIRDNHPITVNIHNAAMLRDSGTYYRPNTLPLRGNVSEDVRSPQATPYLASLQHNLQKPGEIANESPFMKSTREVSSEKIPIPISSLAHGQYCRNSETSVEKMDVLPSFSDSGYQSIGASPMTSSTPVSNVMEIDCTPAQPPQFFIANSPQSLASDLANRSPIMHVSPNRSATFGVPVTLPSPRFEVAHKLKTNALTTSNSSAFIPIQGSPNDIQYVRPIRPTVTMANNNPTPESDVFLSPTRENVPSEVFVISPKSQDPPSYEIAVKQLRQQGSADGPPMETMAMNPVVQPSETNFPQVAKAFGNITNISNAVTNVSVAQAKDFNEKGSLLADMGKTNSPNDWSGLGPYASKLAQLSRQTKHPSSGKPVNTNTTTIMSVLSERQANLVKESTTDQKPNMSTVQSAKARSLPYIPSKTVQDLNLVLGADAHLHIHENNDNVSQSHSANINIHSNAEHINQSLLTNLNVIHEGADLNLNAESESFLPSKFEQSEKYFHDDISTYPSQHSSMSHQARINVVHASRSPRNPPSHDVPVFNHPPTTSMKETPIFNQPSNVNASINNQPIFNQPSNVNTSMNHQPMFNQPSNVNAGMNDQPMLNRPSNVNAGMNDQPMFIQPSNVNAGMKDQPMFKQQTDVNMSMTNKPMFNQPSVVNASMKDQLMFTQPIHTVTNMSEMSDSRFIINPNVNIQEYLSPALSQAIEKELKSADAELNVDELNKTWEAIKEMEGIGGKDIFTISGDDGQQGDEMGNFKMFEDC